MTIIADDQQLWLKLGQLLKESWLVDIVRFEHVDTELKGSIPHRIGSRLAAAA